MLCAIKLSSICWQVRRSATIWHSVSRGATACNVHTLIDGTASHTIHADAQVRTNDWDLDRDCDLLRAHITEQMAGVLEPGTWRLIETIQASRSLWPHCSDITSGRRLCSMPKDVNGNCHSPSESALTWHAF